MPNLDPIEELNIYLTTETKAYRSPEQYGTRKDDVQNLDFTEHSYGWGAIWSTQPFGA